MKVQIESFDPNHVIVLFGRHSDYHRPSGEVSTNGKQLIQTAAQEMFDRKTVPDHVFTSTVRRAKETGIYLVEALENLHHEQNLTKTETVIEAISGLSDSCSLSDTPIAVRDAVLSLPSDSRVCAFVTHAANLDYLYHMFRHPDLTSGYLAAFMGVQYPVRRFGDLKPDDDLLFKQPPSRTFTINCDFH